MIRRILSAFSLLTLFGLSAWGESEAIKIGVSVPLTGEGATFGNDILHGLEFTSEKLFPGKYKFIVEDDQCLPKEASTIAKKFVEVDKVRAVLGLGCNGVLMSSQAIYNRAHIPAIAATATSGDTENIGAYIFQLWPNDQYAAKLLYDRIGLKGQKIAIVTAEDEYTEMMQRTMIKEAAQKGMLTPLTIEFPAEQRDFRAIVTKLRGLKPDSIVVNPQGEAAFIELMKEFKKTAFPAKFYTFYYPASGVVLSSISSEVEGVEFVNSPSLNQIASPKAQEIFKDVVAKYGQPQSVDLMTLCAMESLRLLDEALSSGVEVNDYLHNREFKGTFLGDYRLDSNGSIQGLSFEMQRIQNGKPIPEN